MYRRNFPLSEELVVLSVAYRSTACAHATYLPPPPPGRVGAEVVNATGPTSVRICIECAAHGAGEKKNVSPPYGAGARLGMCAPRRTWRSI